MLLSSIMVWTFRCTRDARTYVPISLSLVSILSPYSSTSPLWEFEACVEWCQQSPSPYTAVHWHAQVTNVAMGVYVLVFHWNVPYCKVQFTKSCLELSQLFPNMENHQAMLSELSQVWDSQLIIRAWTLNILPNDTINFMSSWLSSGPQVDVVMIIECPPPTSWINLQLFVVKPPTQIITVLGLIEYIAPQALLTSCQIRPGSY